MMPFYFLVLYCLFSFLPSYGSSSGKQPLLLEQQIKKIIQPIPGQIGVAALHLESGKRIEVNGDVRFPMASTYKLPIALYCLHLADHGDLDLAVEQVITPEDMRQGSLNEAAMYEGRSLSLRSILFEMLASSSNTGTDMMLKYVGGPQKVTQWIHRDCHIDQMSVDRTTLKMRADYSGIHLNDDYCCPASRYNVLQNRVSKKKYAAANRIFFNDVRDTTTPRAMVDLLAGVYRGKIVSDSSKTFLLDCMEQCKWGKERMKHFLPKNIKIWHKTGRMDGIVSEVGIFELPHHKGHVVLALYSNKSTNHEAKRNLVMAKVSKVLFDHFSV